MKLFLSLFLLLAINQIGFSQSFGESSPLDSDFKPKDVIIWSGLEASKDATTTYTVGLRLETKNGFSIYKSKLKIEGPAGFKIIEGQYPQSKRQKDPLSGKMVEVYYAGDTILKMQSLASFEGSTLPIKITSLGCTERICLFPYTQTVYIPLYKGEQSEATLVESNISIAEKKMKDLTNSSASLGEEDILSLEEEFAERLKDGKLGLGLLLLVVFLGGIATNLTPCVFPMIPITIRLLGTSGKPSFINSFIYASGIVVTYSAIGTMAALSGGLFGALLANVWVNVIFGVLFFILGLSMLGFSDFSKLQNFGTKLGAGKKSFINTFFMGAGAGLVAAPCTGPILGALIVFAARQENPQDAIALFPVYSAGFGLPYIFLGMAASKVSSVKVSPRIQLFIKMLFAAIMFALALFYLKTPAYELLKPMQGYWRALALLLTVAGLATGHFVFNSPKMNMNKFITVIPSLILGIGLFAQSQWLSGADLISKIDWIKSESKAMQIGSNSKRAIMIDGWADWCAACKKMDNSTFRNQKIIAKLHNNWVAVKFDFTQLTDENEKLAEKYGMPGLPTLILLPPNGELSKAKKLTGYISATRLYKELQDFEAKL